MDQAESINAQTQDAAQDARAVAVSIGKQADELVATLQSYLTTPDRMDWSGIEHPAASTKVDSEIRFSRSG